eukprot:5335834-Amphidinium_carterae.1
MAVDSTSSHTSQQNFDTLPQVDGMQPAVTGGVYSGLEAVSCECLLQGGLPGAVLDVRSDGMLSDHTSKRPSTMLLSQAQCDINHACCTPHK